MELLVVFAIIAILISLLLPALGKARGSAYLAQCLSQEKQISTALMMYTFDNEKYFPLSYERYSWDDHISEYLQLDWPQSQKDLLRIDDEQYANEVLLCARDTIEPRPGKFRRSYALNAYNDNNNKPGLVAYEEGVNSMKVTRVIKPSRTVLLGESWDDWNLQGQGYNASLITGAGYQDLRFESPAGQSPKYMCHDGNGKANFTYVDGSGGSRFGGELIDGSLGATGSSGNFKGSWFDSQQ